MLKKVMLATLVSAAFAAAAPFAVAQNADVNAAGSSEVNSQVTSIPGADTPTTVAQAAQERAPNATHAQRHAPHAKQAVQTPSERIEARLAYARTTLKITDAQQSQWDSFASVLRKHAQNMDERMKQRHTQYEAARAQGEAGRGTDARGAHANERPRVSAIEQLERRQQRMAERSARLSEVIAAAKPLYTALSPEQKQIADGMLARREHGGMRQHHRGMHRGA